jgi:predicted GIY-YIG superfamily endonuclease
VSDTPAPWYVYLLRCADGSIYTGITNDVRARVQKHNHGKGAAYTSGRRPVVLIYQEQCPDRGSALRREGQIKGWRKKKKEDLIFGASRITTAQVRPTSCATPVSQ